jgi:hypothetical protein
MTRRSLVTLLIGLTLSASPVFAQDLPPADVSVGSLTVNGTMFGVTLQGTKPLSWNWSLVGEVDWSRGPDPGDDVYTFQDVAVLGGFRYTFAPARRVSPFWQVMAGGLTSKGEGRWCTTTGRCREESFRRNYLVIQPGGGVTAMLTPRFGVRAQLDVQVAVARSEAYVAVFPRFAIGAVIALGRGR